jgi:hypothetical protein
LQFDKIPGSHLQTLQLLSAHMKLLLDAPEHLWSLLERKQYFTAAWLYLLTRVVHRALIREDGQDEDGWTSQGINVLVRHRTSLFIEFMLRSDKRNNFR